MIVARASPKAAAPILENLDAQGNQRQPGDADCILFHHPGSGTYSSHLLGEAMARWFLRVILVIASAFSAGQLSAQDLQTSRQIESLPWERAPSVGKIGAVARVNLVGDMRFLDAASTSKFLELNGNPPRSNNYVWAPSSLDWFSVFIFDASGYVRDDEKLDSAELLSILRRQNEKGMEERKRLNLPVMKLLGWAVEPHYDLKSKRLEWATRLEVSDSGEQVVNYTIRLLGRSGVMSAILVSDPARLEEDIRAFRNSLREFDFVPGERYTEYRSGDRTAEYGLAALIVGGAAAAAAKSGAAKGFGKMIGVAVVGGLAAIGALLRVLFRRKG